MYFRKIEAEFTEKDELEYETSPLLKKACSEQHSRVPSRTDPWLSGLESRQVHEIYPASAVLRDG
jgi:hypothetical protein